MHDQASTLRRIVSRIAAAEGSTSRARKLVLTGCKGGVGTTTLSINLAIALRKFAARVLLIDANPTRGDIAGMCGLHGECDIDDVLLGRKPIEQATYSGPSGVQIVPRFGIQMTAPGANARQLVRQLDASQHAFDYVVIDGGSCPVTAEVLWPTSDRAIVVTTPDNIAVTDSYVLIKSMFQNGINSACQFVVNRFRDELLAQDVANRLTGSCERFLNLPVTMAGAVPDDPCLTGAASSGRMVVCSDPSAPSAMALMTMGKQIAVGDVASNALNSLVEA